MQTILVVDDDVEITTLLTEYLARFGYTTLAAGDAAAMRTQLAAHSGQPASQGPDEVVRFDGWELHCVERHLRSPQGVVVPLSNAEFRLLCTFLRMPRRIFSRDQLMEQARGRAMDAFERSIDLLVSRLRTKLADDPRSPSMIRTVRGAGYLFHVNTLQGQ
eukprot:gene9602-9414_t